MTAFNSELKNLFRFAANLVNFKKSSKKNYKTIQKSSFSIGTTLTMNKDFYSFVNN